MALTHHTYFFYLNTVSRYFYNIQAAIKNQEN